MFVARGNAMILWPEDSDVGYTNLYTCIKTHIPYTPKQIQFCFQIILIPVIFWALLLLKLDLWSLALNRNVERDLGEVEKCSFYCFTRQRGPQWDKTSWPNLEGVVRRFIIMVQRRCDQLLDILLTGWWWGNWESASSTFWFQLVEI